MKPSSMFLRFILPAVLVACGGVVDVPDAAPDAGEPDAAPDAAMVDAADEPDASDAADAPDDTCIPAKDPCYDGF